MIYIVRNVLLKDLLMKNYNCAEAANVRIESALGGKLNDKCK